MIFLKKIKDILKNNIQVSQTIVLISLLVLGIEFYGLNINYLKISVIFLTVMIFDAIFIKMKSGKWSFPYSGINAGFGISFFLRSDELIIYFMAGLLAIAGKNLIKINGRHFLNPSNMGVLLVLILFPHYTWINTLQWGNYTGVVNTKYILIIITILIFGAFITYRVYKFFKYKYFIDYLLPFFILHLIFFFTIPYYESINSALLFFSVSFFIFMFHMISDPKTVPEKSISRFIYSINIVLSFYILQFFINEAYALIASLFVNTIQLPIIWYYEQSNKKVKGKYPFYIVYLLLVSLFMILLITYLINIFGRPDLVFDNVCNQLICK